MSSVCSRTQARKSSVKLELYRLRLRKYSFDGFSHERQEKQKGKRGEKALFAPLALFALFAFFASSNNLCL